jgi:hypothetical protein
MTWITAGEGAATAVVKGARPLSQLERAGSALKGGDEPGLGVVTRPEYVVTRDQAEAVCEVEEFDPVFRRDLAVAFHEELVAGMEAASAEEKMRAINAAKDRAEGPEGHYHRLDVYLTMSPQAATLPAGLFSGPRDRIFEFDAEAEAEAGAYVGTAGPPADPSR